MRRIKNYSSFCVEAISPCQRCHIADRKRRVPQIIAALFIAFALPASADFIGGETTDFSPDGSRFLQASTYEWPNKNSKVVIHDSFTGEALRAFHLNYSDSGSFHVPVDARFSPDGKTIAISNTAVQEDGEITFVVDLYDTLDGHRIQEFGKHERFKIVKNIAFTPDGSRVMATVGYWNHERNFYVWDVASGDLVMKPGFPTSTDKDFVGMSGISTSVPLDRIVIANLYSGIDLWSMTTGEFIKHINTPMSEHVRFFSDQINALLTTSWAKIAIILVRP